MGRLKLKPIAQRIVSLAAQVQPLRMALVVCCELRPLGPGGAHPYDRAHGVRTGRSVPGYLLNPGDPWDSPTTAYVPAQPSVVRSALAMIPEPQQCHFLDIGCGKGRPLLVATEFDFRAITGIEFSRPLAWIARRNAARFARAHPHRTGIEVVTGDALDYELPKDRLVVFLYNPFGRPLIARLLANIEISLRENPRELYIVYYNPIWADVFDASARLERRYAARLPFDPGEIGFGQDTSDTVVIWQNRGNPHPRPP